MENARILRLIFSLKSFQKAAALAPVFLFVLYLAFVRNPLIRLPWRSFEKTDRPARYARKYSLAQYSYCRYGEALPAMVSPYVKVWSFVQTGWRRLDVCKIDRLVLVFCNHTRPNQAEPNRKPLVYHMVVD